MRKIKGKIREAIKDPLFRKVMIVLTIEAVIAIVIEALCYSRAGNISIDRALGLFAIISALTLLFIRKKYPQVIRDCCYVLGWGALILSFIGVAAEYELIPCVPEFIWDFCGGFNPVSTVYSVFCSAILASSPAQTNGENTPKNIKRRTPKKEGGNNT